MTKQRPSFDQRAFRNALGRFPTGVTVVTALAPDGRRCGLTASSFNSVSLDPPLVLWSIGRSSSVLDVFLATERYAINVLAADQIALSRHFARPHEDKFTGIRVTKGLGGVPVLQGCAACFECRNLHQYAGGDHVILVGQVERFSETERTPLAFHAGDYRITAQHPEAQPSAPDMAAAARFIDDHLVSLLARASRLASDRLHARLRPHGIAAPHWRVLAALADGNGMAVSTLAELMPAKQPTVTKMVDRMVGLGLVKRLPAPGDRRKVLVQLTARGRRAVGHVLDQAKAHDAEMLAHYGTAESARLKAAMRDLVERLGGHDAY